MTRRYTPAVVDGWCDKAFESPEFAYDQRVFKWSGVTTEGVPYTEHLARRLTHRRYREALDTIESITRSASYRVNHKWTEKPDSNRHEERYVRAQVKNGSTLDHLGTLVDYAVPLNDKRADKAGKIDLVSATADSFYLLEVKYGSNAESLVRCCLEIYTYGRIVDRKKLLEDFEKAGCLCRGDLPVKLGVLVPKATLVAGHRAFGPDSSIPAMFQTFQVDLFAYEDADGTMASIDRVVAS